MASEWAQSQREGWLCKLYGQDSSDGTRKLPNDSVQSRLVSVLENLLSGKTIPKDAATETASLIMSQEDVGTPWNNLLGLYFSAAEAFGNEHELGALVNYVVELASLPDANNEGQETKTADIGGEVLRIKPSEAVVLGEDRLWSGLPQFSQNVTESFQGPEMYLANLSSPATPDAAKAKWRNLNTFLALLAKSREAQKIPALAGCGRLGIKALVMALEQPPDTRLGQNTELHAPAAAQWIHIANDEIEKLCNDGTEKFTAGDLWAGRGGGEVCDSARLQFWRSRMRELGY